MLHPLRLDPLFPGHVLTAKGQCLTNGRAQRERPVAQDSIGEQLLPSSRPHDSPPIQSGSFTNRV